jgi:hypothetical protein
VVARGIGSNCFQPAAVNRVYTRSTGAAAGRAATDRGGGPRRDGSQAGLGLFSSVAGNPVYKDPLRSQSGGQRRAEVEAGRYGSRTGSGCFPAGSCKPGLQRSTSAERRARADRRLQSLGGLDSGVFLAIELSGCKPGLQGRPRVAAEHVSTCRWRPGVVNRVYSRAGDGSRSQLLRRLGGLRWERWCGLTPSAGSAPRVPVPEGLGRQVCKPGLQVGPCRWAGRQRSARGGARRRRRSTKAAGPAPPVIRGCGCKPGLQESTPAGPSNAATNRPVPRRPARDPAASMEALVL